MLKDIDMEILALMIYTGILTVQSVVCLVSSCRTNDRIDELKATVEKISKNAATRIMRLEHAHYSSSAPPSPSAPIMYDSQPKTYVAPQLSTQPTVYGSL